MSKEFEGLTAAITGAGSGIGLATAKLLVERGAKVYGLDLNEGGLAGVATWITCDVGDDKAVETAFAQIPSLDIMINNAAISAVGTVIDNASEDWLKVLNVNVLGIVRTSKSAIPLLRKSKHAAIVNTCSVAATAGIPKRALYSASKGAVRHLKDD